jgi:hypothetical protein
VVAETGVKAVGAYWGRELVAMRSVSGAHAVDLRRSAGQPRAGFQQWRASVAGWPRTQLGTRLHSSTVPASITFFFYSN